MFSPDYIRQPPAWFHTRILVGAGTFLRPAFIQQHQITHVINCAFHDDSPAWFREIFPDRYVCLQAIDGLDQNILNWYPKFEQTMQRFLREGNGTVYVHCQAGINRSAFLALLYVAKNFHINLDSLISTTKRQRPCMFTNTTFRKQVEDFINGCLSREKDERIGILDDDRRNVGLSSSRNSSELERL
jgi:hypothetical protein